MTVNVSPELEARIREDVAKGEHQSIDECVEDALNSYFEEQEENARLHDLIEEGWAAAERGDLIDGEEAFEMLDRMKEAYRRAQLNARL